MNVFSEVTVTAASVLHDTTIVLRKVARTEFTALDVGNGVEVHFLDEGSSGLSEVASVDVLLRKGRDFVSHRSEKGGVDHNDQTHGNDGRAPCAEEGSLLHWLLSSNR